MPSGKQLAGVLIAMTIAAVLLNPIASIVATGTGTQTVDNETVTAQHGATVDLDGYNVDDSTELVQYQNSSGVWKNASEGTDYELYPENGTIYTYSSGAIEDGEQIRVDYEYQATEGTTTTVTQLVPLFVALLILMAAARKIQEMM